MAVHHDGDYIAGSNESGSGTNKLKIASTDDQAAMKQGIGSAQFVAKFTEPKADLDLDKPKQDECVEELDDDLVTWIAGLKSLQPSRQQEKHKKFRALFPVIKEVLAAKVSQRSVIDYLASQGLKLSPNTFRTMLNAASQRAAESDLKLTGQQARNS